MNDKKAMILAFAVFAVMIAVGAAGFIGADEADAETDGKFIVTGGGGETSYDTFEAAVAAAKNLTSDEKIVKFNADDISFPTKYTDESNEIISYTGFDVTGLTIDLNGKTISAQMAGFLLTGKDFTVRNGTINTDASYSLWIGNISTETENVTMSKITSKGGINICNATDVVISECVISVEPNGDYYAVWCDQCAEATIVSGTYASSGRAVLGGHAGSNNDASMLVKGGTFKVRSGQPVVLTADFMKPTIIGGFFYGDDVDAETIEAELENYILPSCVIEKTTEDGKTGCRVAGEAAIGDQKYATLEDAIAAVTDGQTITLLRDVDAGTGIGIFKSGETYNVNGKAMSLTAGQSFTIDFGSYAYYVNGPPVGSKGTENQAFHLERDISITLKNGTLGATEGANNTRMVIQNYCDLTLDGMTVDGTNLGLPASTYYTLSNNYGNVVIKDSKIIAKSGCIAFDVCGYEGYGDHSVTVRGNTVVDGDIELSNDGKTSRTVSLTIENIDLNGSIKESTGGDTVSVAINSGTFSDLSGLPYVAVNGEYSISNKVWKLELPSTVMSSGAKLILSKAATDLTMSENSTFVGTIQSTGGQVFTTDGIKAGQGGVFFRPYSSIMYLEGNILATGDASSMTISGRNWACDYDKSLTIGSGVSMTIAENITFTVGQSFMIDPEQLTVQGQFKAGASMAVEGATKYYSSLASALNQGADEIKLEADVSLSKKGTFEIKGDVTIDLNGHNIIADEVRAIHVMTGTLELTGTGTVKVYNSSMSDAINKDKSVILVGDTGAKAGLVVGKDVTITTDVCYGVTAFGTNESISVQIDGKVSVGTDREAFANNGTEGLAATTVTIGSGASLSSTGRNAIYFPGTGTLDVYGELDGGVEAKAGTVTIKSGAQITAKGTISHVPNNNDPSTMGYALAVVNSSGGYAGKVVATIEDGATVSGPIAIIDDDIVADEKKGRIVINGGSFSDASGLGFAVSGKTYNLIGNGEISGDITMQAGAKLSIADNKILTIPSGKTLKMCEGAIVTGILAGPNNNRMVVDGMQAGKDGLSITGGSLTINGTVVQADGEYDGVTVKISGNDITISGGLVGDSDEKIAIIEVSDDANTNVVFKDFAQGDNSEIIFGVKDGESTSDPSKATANVSLASNVSLTAIPYETLNVTTEYAYTGEAITPMGFPGISYKTGYTLQSMSILSKGDVVDNGSEKMIPASKKDVGTYVIYYQIEVVEDATSKVGTYEVKRSWSITPMDIEIKLSDATKTYDGKTSFETSKISFSQAERVTATAADYASEDVGTHDVTLVLSSDVSISNFRLIYDGNVLTSVADGENWKVVLPNAATITQKEITINWSGSDASYSFEYNGQNQKSSVSASYQDVDGKTVALTVTPNITMKNVGEYTFTASFKNGETNYSLPAEKTNTYSITPKEIVIDWITTEQTDEYSFEYNGKDQKNSVSASYEDVGGSTVALTVALDGEMKDVKDGGYTFTASFEKGETNYKLPEEKTKTYQITQKEITIDWSGADASYSFEYNGMDQKNSVSATAGDVISGETVALKVSIDGEMKNVGSSYTFTAAFDESISEANKNYKLPGTTTQTYSITPKEISITWSGSDAYSFVYNGQDQSRSVSASYQDVDGKTVDLTVALEGEMKDVKDGGYTFTASFKNGETNYSLPTEKTKTYLITQKELQSGMATVSGTYTYNGTEQTVTIAVTDSSVLTEDTDYTLGGTLKGTDVTTYNATVTGKGNYKGTLTVNWNISQLDISDFTPEVTNALLINGSVSPVVKVQKNGVDVAGTPTYYSDDAYSSEVQVSAMKVGTYYVKFTPTDSTNITGEAKGSFQVVGGCEVTFVVGEDENTDRYSITVTESQFLAPVPKAAYTPEDKEFAYWTTDGGTTKYYPLEYVPVDSATLELTAVYVGTGSDEPAEVDPTVSIDVPQTFYVGEEYVFSISTTKGTYEGNVKGTADTSKAPAYKIWYYETQDGNWYELTGASFGPSSGFPMMDATSYFKIVFLESGTFDFKVEIVDASDSTVVCDTTEKVVVVENRGLITEVASGFIEDQEMAEQVFKTYVPSYDGGVDANTMFIVYDMNEDTKGLTGHVWFDGKGLYSESLGEKAGTRSWLFSDVNESQFGKENKFQNGLYRLTIQSGDDVLFEKFIEVTLTPEDEPRYDVTISGDGVAFYVDGLRLPSGTYSLPAGTYAFIAELLPGYEGDLTIEGAENGAFTVKDGAVTIKVSGATQIVAPEKFTVTFMADGETSLGSVTVVEGESVALPSAPSVDGKKFVGWEVDGTEDKDIVATYGYYTPSTTDVTLVAVYEDIDAPEHSLGYYVINAVNWQYTDDLKYTYAATFDVYADTVIAAYGHEYYAALVESIKNKELNEEAQKIMFDFARYMGALYRTADGDVKSVYFDGKEYTWQTGEKELEGSNWCNSGTSLVKSVLNYILETSKTQIVMEISDGVDRQALTYGAVFFDEPVPEIQYYDVTISGDGVAFYVDGLRLPAGTYSLPEGEHTFIAELLPGYTGTLEISEVVEDGKFTVKDGAVTITVTGATLIVAPEKYTVTFMANGKSLGSVTVVKDDSVALPSAPSVDGKKFVGWKVGKTDEIIEPYGYYKPAADVTLTASYEEIEVQPAMRIVGAGFYQDGDLARLAMQALGSTYSGGVDDNTMFIVYSQSGYGSSTTMKGTVTYGGNEIYSEDLLGDDGVRTWLFSDMNQLKSKFVNGMYTVSIYAGENVVLSADVYVSIEAGPVVYTVSFESSAGKADMGSVTVPAGGSVALPLAPSVDGMKFVGWKISGTEGKDTVAAYGYYTPEKTVTLVAVYEDVEIEKTTWTLSYTNENADYGSVFVTSENAKGSFGVAVAVPADGYKVASVVADANGTVAKISDGLYYVSSTEGKDVVITVEFVEISVSSDYTITINNYTDENGKHGFVSTLKTDDGGYIDETGKYVVKYVYWAEVEGHGKTYFTSGIGDVKDWTVELKDRTFEATVTGTLDSDKYLCYGYAMYSYNDSKVYEITETILAVSV